MSATPPLRPRFEVAYDFANRSVDFLHLRPTRADGTEGPPGDYSGGHWLASMTLDDRWGVELGLWRRRIDYVSTQADITTWQFAVQRLLGADDTPWTTAVRMGVWGNRSPLLRKTSNVTVQGFKFTSAQATDPNDIQLQLDLLGRWTPRAGWGIGGLASLGSSRLDFNQVSATSQSKGSCEFQVEFTPTHVIETCTQTDGTTLRIATPNEVLGIDIDREGRYRATYASLGVNTDWTLGRYRLRAGVVHTELRRDGVDQIVRTRGGRAFTSTTIALAEATVAWRDDLRTFVRAQVMERQFVAETPLTYNSLTASQHRRRYGILSVGAAFSF